MVCEGADAAGEIARARAHTFASDYQPREISHAIINHASICTYKYSPCESGLRMRAHTHARYNRARIEEMIPPTCSS